MRFQYLLILCFLIFSCKKKDVPLPLNPGENPETENLKDLSKDIRIANWNIEWFGDASMFSYDLDEQQENAGKILKFLDADLYGLCEIVDTARLGKAIRKYIGTDFAYKVSPYANATQKLAFVYNKNIFRNVQVRPFMGLSGTAAYNFSNGRFPYMLSTDVRINNTTQKMYFILLHAKASGGDKDYTSYDRRMNGSIEMKDSLDSKYATDNFIILGDFNDHLNGSFTIGKSDSPYKNIVMDITRYYSISLPLNTIGYQSTLGYKNSVIDQQIISNEVTKWYKSGSIKIRTDVTDVVPNYLSGNTSDHYPVTSEYDIR